MSIHDRASPMGFEEFAARMATTCGGLTTHERWLLSQGWAAGYAVGARAESEVQRLLETDEDVWDEGHPYGNPEDGGPL